MTISVELTVTLQDPSEWTTAFGIEDRPEIREDVKSYLLNIAQHSGVFGNGEVTATVQRKR
jgi:hypothetical protein